MKLKIKKKLKTPLVKTNLIHQYLQERRESDYSYAIRLKICEKWFAQTFQSILPDQPLELIHMKIGYELQMRDLASIGQKPSERLLKNYAASQTYSVKDFDKNIRDFIEIQIKIDQRKEQEMAKKKAEKHPHPKIKRKLKIKIKKNIPSRTKIKNSHKGNMSQHYRQIFEKQWIRKLTDQQITQIIKEKSQKKPTLQSISTYRSLFNSGKLSGQKHKPIKKIKRYI